MITAATRVAGVIGDPVRHSLSPRLHNAAYRALGLDWVYVAFEVPDGGAVAAVEAARVLDLVGLSVTMPHKRAVVAACDELTPDAVALNSVNTVTRRADGRALGDSTDGPGFLGALADAGVDPAGQTVLLLGAGGAARAVARALGNAGARVSVAARKPALAAEAAALAAGRAVDWDDRDAAAEQAGIVVNATPLGMDSGASGGTELPVSAESIGRGQVFAELVYHPAETALLARARDRGAVVVGGLGMLVHQAALQVERWAGRPAPLDAMWAAVDPGAARS